VDDQLPDRSPVLLDVGDVRVARAERAVLVWPQVVDRLDVLDVHTYTDLPHSSQTTMYGPPVSGFIRSGIGTWPLQTWQCIDVAVQTGDGQWQNPGWYRWGA
jgi:hypothetical protein